MKKTLYDILGVAADADDDQILLAYRQRMESATGEQLDPNERVFLKEAYSILSQANQRAAYDASLIRESQATQRNPVELDFEGPATSRRWLVWMALGLVLAGAIYAWQTRKPPKPQAVVMNRVIILDRQSSQLADPPNTAPMPVAEKSAEELFALLAPSTAMVIATNRAVGRTVQGSAVVVDRGSLITNCHVTRGSNEIQVRIGGEIRDAQVDTADEEFDLCRLSVPGLSAPPVAIANVAAIRTGQKVLALGAPRGLELTISEGIVSSLRQVTEGTIIQTTAPISPGSSGGGLFNTSGELVGIVTMTNRYGQNLNFAVPADWIGQMRDRTASAEADSGTVGRAPKKNAVLANNDAMSQRVLGRWHCFRPDIGRHIDLEFMGDGNVSGSELEHALGGRYSVPGETLTLYGSKTRYFRIEGMSDSHMVLTEDRLRIACDRTS